MISVTISRGIPGLNISRVRNIGRSITTRQMDVPHRRHRLPTITHQLTTTGTSRILATTGSHLIIQVKIVKNYHKGVKIVSNKVSIL